MSEFIASLETDVKVSRSVDQIRALVERFGAGEFSIQYHPTTGQPIAVSFKVRDPGLAKEGDIPAFLPVALRAPSETVYKLLIKRSKSTWQSDKQKAAMRERAERVAWRNLHDFVRASLIGVQTGIMSLGEAFMANLVVTLPTGEAKRLGELAAEGQMLKPSGGRLLLGSGT